MRIAIGAAGIRGLPAIVEIQLGRVTERPPAGAAVQGQGRYEFSIGQDQSGLLDGGR